MASGADQSDELSVLDSDNGSVSLSNWLYNLSILIIWCLDNAQLHTFKVSIEPLTIFISFI